MKIKAAQHIFGNVEIEKSPRKMEGFQTLFYTLDKISSAELLEIEKRVLYYFSDKNPVKYAFFPLENKVVVSRTVPRPEIDQFGRCGIYFSHNLVFDKDDFVKINANPFVIFQNFKFMESPDEAINKSDFKTEDIKEIEIEIPDEDLKEIELLMIQEAKTWRKETKKLAYIACNSRKLAEEKKVLKIEAEEKGIENFLKAVFSLVPSQYRMNISFDTYFHKCDPVRNYFNIIGILPGESFYFTNYVPVDITKKIVDYAVKQYDSLYLKWINKLIEHSNWEDILNNKEIVCAFENFINNKPYKPYDKKLLIEASDGLISTLAGFEREEWELKVKNEITKQFGEIIKDRVASVILSTCKPKDLLVSVLEGFDKSKVAEILYEELLKDLNNINQSEFYYIEKLSGLNKGLIVILSFLRKDDKFKEHLGKFDRSEYEEFASSVLTDKPERMYDLLLQDKRDLFIEVLVSISQKNLRIEKSIRENIFLKVKNKIKEDFTENIAEIAAKYIIENYGLKEILTCVFEGFDLNSIAKAVYEGVLINLDKISSSTLKDMEALCEKLSEKGEYKERLLAVVSFLREDENYQDYFCNLNREDCEKIAESVVAKKPWEIEKFFKIINVLIEKENWKNLEVFKFSLDKLSSSQLDKIKDSLKNNKDAPKNDMEFIKKLDELLLSKSKKLFSFPDFKSFFRI